MADTKAYVVHGQMTADTSTFDLTTGAETSRSPTGAIVFTSFATALDTDAPDAEISVGMTDFTTTYCYSTSAEDGVDPSDTSRRQGASGNILEIHAPGNQASLSRSATVAAITGGIRITPVQSGTQFRVVAWLFFGTAAKCAMAGDATSANSSYNIAHGFTNAPKLGICASAHTDSTAAQHEIAMGFFTYISSTIKQRAFSQCSQSSLTDTRPGTREVYTNRALYCMIDAFDGTEDHSLEVTAVGTTNVTVTARTGTVRANTLWLILELDDVDCFLDTVTSPSTAASDWSYTGAPFQPQFVGGLLTMSDSEAAGGSSDGWDNAIGGAWGAVAFDAEGTIVTVSHHDEVDAGSTGSGSSLTNTDSRVSQALRLTNDVNSTQFDMDNPSFTASGFTFASADITTAASARLWPMIFIAAAASGGAAPIVQHRNQLRFNS